MVDLLKELEQGCSASFLDELIKSDDDEAVSFPYKTYWILQCEKYITDSSNNSDSNGSLFCSGYHRGNSVTHDYVTQKLTRHIGQFFDELYRTFVKYQ